MTGKELGEYITRNGFTKVFVAHQLDLSRQAFNAKLKAKTVKKELVDAVTGIVKPVATEGKRYSMAPIDVGYVSESAGEYGTKKPDLKGELSKVYAENVSLHQTIAERGKFILQLLNQNA